MWNKIFKVSVLVWAVFVITMLITHVPKEDKPVMQPLVSRDEMCVNELTSKKELDEKWGKDRHYISDCLVSHYCACKICCGKWADGKDYCGLPVVEGKTIAVDPKVIPLGSTVVVDGHEYIATDTGAFTGNHVDIYVADHEQALHLGISYKTIYYIKGE